MSFPERGVVAPANTTVELIKTDAQGVRHYGILLLYKTAALAEQFFRTTENHKLLTFASVKWKEEEPWVRIEPTKRWYLEATFLALEAFFKDHGHREFTTEELRKRVQDRT